MVFGLLWLHTDMIEELIIRGQQLDAVHFTFEVGLVHLFPPVPLLKAYLRDAKKATALITDDSNNSGRSAVLSSICVTRFLCWIHLQGSVSSALAYQCMCVFF